MRIAMLCPSRGRPRQARKMQDSFPCDVLFYLDEDDPERGEYNVKKGVVGPAAPITYLYNLLWQQNPGYDAYGLLADDCVNQAPQIVTTLDVRSRAYPHGIWVAGAFDGIEKGSFPAPIVSKRWADTLGYVINPIYVHWYGDSSTTRLAQAAGCFADISPTVEIRHEHPKTGLVPKDETYNRIRAPLKHQRDTFVASIERYFEADLALLKETIENG